jgi:disulfide bond formation protein DsbB
MTLFGFGGFAINFIIAMNLSRQEYIRRWYFHCRDNPTDGCPVDSRTLAITPPKNWLPEIDTSHKSLGESIKRSIYMLGRASPGYCVLWTELFAVVSVLFLIFGLFNWFL